MDAPARTDYDPKTVKLLTFHDAVPAFLDGTDTPRDYLERCISTIEARDPQVQAFVSMNLEGARTSADASTERYHAGKPLSPIDGMPIAIKDLYLTEDMPTQMGSPIYKDYQSPRDCSFVFALRRSGAIILGKVVTTEFGFYHPGPATNPFDSERTPGGSSSGSGACVGASMVPVAIGSQAASSLLRPASFCGNVGFKPTYGALNRAGGHSAISHAVIGPHAGCLEDAWKVAYQISSTLGGDAGQPGLYGEASVPEPKKPKRIAFLQTPGWEVSDQSVRNKLEEAVNKFASQGIEIVSKDNDQRVATLERELEDCYSVCMEILGYELRWPFELYCEKTPDLVSDDLRERVEGWKSLTPSDYRRNVERREQMCDAHEVLKDDIDACITLASVGIAPVGIHSTANPIYGVPASVLGAPALSLPFLEMGGMPLGLQLLGYRHGDSNLFSTGNWAMRNFPI